MVRRLRIGSGIVLFAFVLTHFLNHALGLISLEALEAGRAAFLWLWRSWPGTLVLYGALLAHLILALMAIYQRRELRMSVWEWAQLVLGLAIPTLLVIHVLGTRMAHELFGLTDSYRYLLLLYFHIDLSLLFRQMLLMLIVWIHGCIGLHFWLRLKPWYGPLAPYALAVAVLVPVVSALGVVVGGRTVLRLAADPQWLDGALADFAPLSDDRVAFIYQLQDGILIGLGVALLAVLAGRQARVLWERRRGIVRLTYPDGRAVPIVTGTTILEASRAAGIPHASVCGGRGRCSTCRVRVGHGAEALSHPSAEELKVLARIGAPPNVRLACQTRPAADVEITPLLVATVGPRAAQAGPGYLQGVEREIAILFADLRGFTSLAENKLPYDVVFILNRYFATMGEAVEQAGGRIDKFIGDGVMALFGVDSGVDDACGQALAAARLMAQRLSEMNAVLKNELETPLRMGIGIHIGPAIVGEMGYGHATSVTAVGDAVNTASRLEAMTKDFGAQLILSEPVADHAGVDLDAYPREEIEVRGRDGLLAVRVIKNAQALPAR